MADKQSILAAIATERQQFLDAIAAKDQVIAEKDATITDLQNQLANSPSAADLDEIQTGIEGIVP